MGWPSACPIMDLSAGAFRKTARPQEGTVTGGTRRRLAL